MEQACSYRYLENGIHEFQFHRPSTQAVDQWLDLTTTALEGQPEGQEYRAILHLLAGGMLPVNYMLTQVRNWQKAHPQYKAGRLAIIYTNGSVLRLVEMITNMLTGRLAIKARFFSISRRDEAVEWLLS